MKRSSGTYLTRIESTNQIVDDIFDFYEGSAKIDVSSDGNTRLNWTYLDNGWIRLGNLLEDCCRGVYINTYGRIVIFPSGVIKTREIDGEIRTILCENGTEYLIDEDGNKLSIIFQHEEFNENKVDNSLEKASSSKFTGVFSPLFTLPKKPKASSISDTLRRQITGEVIK